ncbi:hypothetical protein A9Q84_09870 [Halobacteriovorax marinus]|uniref:Uncharacterized protein n=1 Tax=Halobacteriovorax marinus TaxID=97084 RepID=A0A1Y5FDG0_9BACT|nr:hypothetical protein A9Q84_09870 [Halobacteriovorax marinus]
MKGNAISLILFMLSLSVQAASTQEIFIESAKNLLPKKVLTALNNSSVSVQFSRLNDVELTTPCDGQGYIYGKHNSGEITLSEQLLTHLTPNNEEQFSCKHKNLYKTALSTLLHEYFHAYEETLDKKNKIHANNSFISLGFWKLNKKKSKNFNTYAERSLNYYEYSSKKEFVAVNFEYFLLDPAFKCRRPNLYSAYQKEFNHTPFNEFECSSLREISYSDTNVVKTLTLESSYVREIHFLFASEGQAMMSRWGHSMYKLVLCDPSWELKKCRTRGKSVVIGFLAQVSDVSINAVRGVFGDYPSDLVITDLNSMKRQYNRAELRDLESFPLKMTVNQKERFLNHLMRVYWEYSGQYYFFTNNCADEAFKFLQVTYDRDDFYKTNIVTPLGIKSFVKKQGLIFDYDFKDKVANRKNGLFYEGFQSKLMKSFNFIKGHYKDLFKVKIKKQKTLKRQRKFSKPYRYVKDIAEYATLSTEKRKSIIENILKTKEKKTILHLFAIESQAHYVGSNILLQKMQEKSANLVSNEGSRSIFGEIVDLKNIILFGTNSENSGYGIPQAGDLESVISDDVMDAQLALREVKKDLQEKYKEIFEEEFTKINESNENKVLIKKALRSVL